MKQHKPQRKIFYVGSGMLLLAIVGSLIYYVIYFDLFIFVMSFVITILAIRFILFHYKRLSDFYYLSLGTIIYVANNILGNEIQTIDQSNIIYVSLPFLFVVLLLIFSLKKEINWKI